MTRYALPTKLGARAGEVVSRGVALALAAAVAAPVLVFAPLPARAQFAPPSFADLAERLSPAVVNISTAQTVTRPNRGPSPFPPGSELEDFFKDFFERRRGGSQPRRVQSLGSGFVIDAEGYVVTNNHVIENADEIEVNFPNGDSFPAELIGTDPKTDIALLRIASDETFPFVPFGDSDAIRVGDWVLAIGNPFGLGGSVSAGIISARDRDINAGPYDDFLQTDAAINRGNSGGPLFNMAGEVIGVNTAIISPTGGSIGIGFSVPSNLAQNVIDQLRRFGETRRGWLGVRIQEVDEAIAESLGLDGSQGALVAGLSDEGPAAAAGVEAGDVILQFDGRPIVTMRDLPRLVAETEVGRTVDVVVFREGDTQTLSVEIALLEEDRPDSVTSGDGDPDGQADQGVLGMTFGPLDRASRTRFGIDEAARGVVVLSVDPAGSAAERGVRPGDVLVEVSQREVATPSEAIDAIEAARAKNRRSVLLMLNREGQMRFIAVEFEK
ncbi:MAG: DegQ family serine endoprotease [Pseudomonadota bacterium]